MLLTGFFSNAMNTNVQVRVCEPFQQVNQKLSLQNTNQNLNEVTYFIDTKNNTLFKKGYVFKVILNAEKNMAQVFLNQFSSRSDNTIPLPENCISDTYGSTVLKTCQSVQKINLEQFYFYRDSKRYDGLLNQDQLSQLAKSDIQIDNSFIMTTEFFDQLFSFNSTTLNINVYYTKDSQNKEYITASSETGVENSLPLQRQMISLLKSKSIVVCPNQNSSLVQSKLNSFFKN